MSKMQIRTGVKIDHKTYKGQDREVTLDLENKEYVIHDGCGGQYRVKMEIDFEDKK